MNYTPYQIRQFVIEAELQALAAAQREGDTTRYECPPKYTIIHEHRREPFPRKKWIDHRGRSGN